MEIKLNTITKEDNKMEEEKQKKKFSKKYLAFGLFAFLAVGLVSAMLVPYLSNKSSTDVSVDSPFVIGEFNGDVVVHGGETAEVNVQFQNLAENNLPGRLQISIFSNEISINDFNSIMAEFKNADIEGQSDWTTGEFNLLTDESIIDSVEDNGDVLVITTKDQEWSALTTWDATAKLNFNSAVNGDYTVEVQVIPESTNPVYN